MYNMFGVLFVASVTTKKKKRDSGVYFGLGEIVIPGEIVDFLDFWPLLATCHRDDMCKI